MSSKLLFPAPILSSAEVVQRIFDSVVAKSLPNVVQEDSALHVNHVLVRLVSILILSQELDLLPEKIAIIGPSVSKKIAHLLYVRAVELASARLNVYFIVSCQSVDKMLPRSRFILTSGSNNCC